MNSGNKNRLNKKRLNKESNGGTNISYRRCRFKDYSDKAQTRTFHRLVKGSGLNALVRAAGLEPARVKHRFLRPACLPFQHARIYNLYFII